MTIALLSPFHFLRRMTLFAGPAVLDQMIVSGMNFLVAIYLARTLGIVAFGQFSIVLIIVYFCLEMHRAIVTAPMMFFAAKEKENNYFSHIILFQFMFSVCIALFCVGFIHVSGIAFPKWQIDGFTFSGGLLVFTRLIQEFLRRMKFIKNQAKDALILDGVACILIVSGLVFLNRTHQTSVVTVMYLHAICYGVSFLYFLPMLVRFNKDKEKSFLNFLKKQFNYGGWLLIAVIATYASSNYFLLSGGALLGSEATGLLKTAQYVMGGMIVLFQAMENIIPYRMAQAAHDTQAHLKTFFWKTFSGMLLFCSIHAIVVLLFLDQIIALLSLQNVLLAEAVLKANIVFSFVLVINYSLQYLLRALDKPHVIFVASAITAVFSIASAPFIIKYYGVIGIVGGLFLLQFITFFIFLSFLLFTIRGAK